MTRLLRTLLLLLLCTAATQAADPLRVFIRAGAKTHGPNQHDHPRFLTEWTKLLTERGAKVEGGLTWPTADQFDHTDVVIVFAPDPWDTTPEVRAQIDKFAARGGSFVVLHDAVCGHQDPDWTKSLLGGAWHYDKTKWFEGDISFYYVNNTDPITVGASNFDVHDEMYYDLDMNPAAKVLAATWTPDARAQQNGRAFPHIYNEAPQIWTYENKGSRAFVDLLGHEYATLEAPHVRAVLLRGLAWAGKRASVDEFCSQEELGSLRYPAGGPSAPTEEAKKLTVHPDFKATLVAAEPLINKAIAMDWDAKGRLWVAETPEYPNGRRGLREDFAGTEWRDHGGLVPAAGVQTRPGQDRISILIDTDGDGMADKKEIFYEGLDLVTGFVFYRDGVIACAAPDVWWIRDTDGDGKADKVEKIYTGLGTGDTHAVINNLRWGADGWIYATHGYSGSDHVSTGDRKKDFGRIGSGVVRFQPDGSAFEQFSSKGGNTWGLAITSGNDVFWTQPTSGDLVMETLLPESTLARGRAEGAASFQVVTKSPKSFPEMTWQQQAYRQIDFVGSFTAAAGCAIYDGGTWPAQYANNYFCTEPTINIVHHEIFDPAGVSFAGRRQEGREQTEFIRSGDLWFRPIEVRVGPDGALYVIDFYNQAVIHNDTRGPVHNKVNAAVRPDRDHYFARIWRIDHKDAKTLPVPDLSKATSAELVAALRSVNRPVRFTAQRLLAEASVDSSALADYNAQLQKLATDSQAPAAARSQALWTLHARQALDDTTIDAVFAAGLAQLKNAPAGDSSTLAVLLKVLADEPAQATKHLAQIISTNAPAPASPLQLAALRALGAAEPSPASHTALVALLPSLTDPFTQSAALAAANRAPGAFLAVALASGAHGETATALLPFLSSVAATLSTQPDQAAQFIQLLAQQNQPDGQLSAAILGRLAASARPENRPRWTPELNAALHTLLSRSESETAATMPLAVAWDNDGKLQPEIRALLPKLVAQLNAPGQGEDALGTLAANLISARALSPAIIPAISQLLSNAKTAPTVQQRIVEVLGDTGDPAIAATLIAPYAKFSPALQRAAFAQLLKRKEWTRSMIEALSAGSLPLESLGVVALDKLRHHADPETARFAGETIDKIRGPLTQKKDELIASLLPVVQEGGDPAKGKLIFATCAACHRYNGEGATLAPDLTGMGAHPRAELLTHIVDPNREVDPSFAAFDFQTKTGDIFQGIVSSENAKAVRVRDAAGEHEILKADIASRSDVGRSLMPEGFEALGAEGLRDLISYLQAANSRFRVLDLRASYTADSRRGIFANEENVNDTLKFRKFGNVQVADVPYVISDPAVIRSGKNLIVLRGGSGHAKDYPLKVEIPGGKVEANTLHILGGIGGWAFPCCGDEKGEGLPVAKVTVQYVDGTNEELVLKNGVEIADFIRPHDVPGSRLAEDLVNGQQVRVITKALKGGVIDKITLESYDNRVVPVFVALTAEKAEAASAPKPVVSSR